MSGINYYNHMDTEKKNLLSELGEKIKAARINTGMTQEMLAEKLNMSRISVAKYEAGEVEPKMTNLVRISKVLGISMDDLLGPKENKSLVLEKLSDEANEALSRFIEALIKQYIPENKK